MGDIRAACQIFSRKPEGEIQLRGPTSRLKERYHYKQSFKKQGVRVLTEFSWHRIGSRDKLL
jgi:hypothetical protein